MKGSSSCQCLSGRHGRQVSSLGLSEPSSTLSRQEGAVAPPGLTPLNQGPGWPALGWCWQLQGQHSLLTEHSSPPPLTYCIGIALALESLLKCLAQPNQLQGVLNFSPHFRTWPPAPFRWGGGSHSVFPKTQLLVHYVYFLRRVN